MNDKTKPKLIILLLALLFILPGISAIYVYYNQGTFGLTKTNKGDLLIPPVKVALSPHIEKWQIVLWSPKGCDTTCLLKAEELAKVRLALGRRLYEVNNLLVVAENSKPISPEISHKLQQIDFNITKSSAMPQAKSQIYLMSPEGYLILSYAEKEDLRDLLFDLKKMLRARG